MRFLDILKFCFFNLWRRKIRTILAILGVFIGIFSILATVSIGLALSYNLDASLENLPGIRIITLYPGKNDDSKGPGANNVNPFLRGGSGKEKEDFAINNKNLTKIKSFAHIAAVSPVLGVRGNIIVNQKNSYINLQAVNPEIFPYFSSAYLVGGAFKDNTVVLPENTIRELENLYGYYDEEQNKYIEPPLDKHILDFYHNKNIQFTMQDLYDEDMPRPRFKDDDEESDEEKEPPLNYEKFDIKITGIIKDGFSYGTGYTTFKTIFSYYEKMKKINPANHSELKMLLNEYDEYKKSKTYSRAFIAVDEFKNVKTVYESLKKKGYNVSSSIDMFDSIKEMFTYVQLVLGSLGAISLLVAMIGITNTTIMTIYERTREIGIMKVLGSPLTNIRNLFLFESGLIGFSGGLIGSIVAVILSKVVNFLMRDSYFLKSQDLGDGNSGLISYIPLWLILLALVISTAVGLIAGYLPSRRAMKMSALESLKGE